MVVWWCIVPVCLCNTPMVHTQPTQNNNNRPCALFRSKSIFLIFRHHGHGHGYVRVICVVAAYKTRHTRAKVAIWYCIVDHPAVELLTTNTKPRKIQKGWVTSGFLPSMFQSSPTKYYWAMVVIEWILRAKRWAFCDVKFRFDFRI